MAKITEKKVKSATRAANEVAVENNYNVVEEKKELTTIEKISKDIDRVMLAQDRKYITKDEMIAILNSYIKD